MSRKEFLQRVADYIRRGHGSADYADAIYMISGYLAAGLIMTEIEVRTVLVDMLKDE